MTKEEIEVIWRWARQPRESVWRNWIALLHGKPGVTEEKLKEFKPQISLVCEPLFGRLVWRGRKRKLRKPKLVYPSKEQSICTYHEGVDIIRAFGEPTDFLRLAVYRRQVSLEEIQEIDVPFFALVLREEKALSMRTLRKLIVRMPDNSWIYNRLTDLVRCKNEYGAEDIPAPLLLAAD